MRDFYCAEQYVSWEGTTMVFDNTPSAASGGDEGTPNCFQQASLCASLCLCLCIALSLCDSVSLILTCLSSTRC